MGATTPELNRQGPFQIHEIFFLLHTTYFFSKWLWDCQDKVHQPLSKNNPQLGDKWFRRQLCVGVLNHPCI